MPVRCAVCEADNRDDATECASCGKPLAAVTQDVEPQTVAGLEATLAEPVDVEVAAIAGLEATGVASRDLEVDSAPMPGVEPTQLDADASAPANWTTGAVEIETGREIDFEPRTAAPAESATCPFCGVASLGAVCDSCGRRKARYVAASPLERIAASGESRLCPACFARVPAGARCEECGVPFPAQER
jgi:hypothetical protein